MSTIPSPPDGPAVRPRRSWSWLFYLAATLALIIVIAWATLGEINRNPARSATADLGQYGLVTVQLTTNPNPPKPTGTVQLSFMPMDPRRRAVPVDGLTYEYGRAGSEQAAGTGNAQAMPDGSGMFMASVQFPDVGNWWVRVRLSKGGAQGEVRFIISVRPAQ